MTLFKAFFGSGTSIQTPLVPEPPFHEKALEQLNLLEKFVKEMSNSVSTEVYSQLRTMDDIIRPLLEYLKTHDIAVEQEVLIQSTITDYIPTPLETFRMLPENDKLEGGKGNSLLLQQYDTIESNIRELSDEIYGRVLSALNTQANFIKSKFNSGE